MELNLYEVNEFNKEIKKLNESLNNEDNKKVYEYAKNKAEELKKELKKIQIKEIQDDGNLTVEEWSKKDFLEKEIAKNQEKISQYEASKEDFDKKIFQKRLEKEELKRELDLEEAKIEIELSNIKKKWNNALKEQNENEEKIKQLRLANKELDENSEEAQKNLSEILELQNRNEELTRVMQENVITSKKGMELNRQQEEIKEMKNILESGTVLEGLKNPKETEQEKQETVKQVEEEEEPAKPVEEKTEPAKPVEEKTEPAKPVEEKTEPAKPVEEKTEPAKPVEEKTEPVKPVEEKTEPAKPVEEKTEPVKPVEEKTEPVKPVEEKQKPEKSEVVKIKVSAKDNTVYLNDEPAKNLNFQEILQNKKNMFKRIGITELIKEELKDEEEVFLNPLKIISIRRKLDPIIISAIEKCGEDKTDLMIKDYIYAISQKEIDITKGSKEIKISYDLTNSKLDEQVDKKIQKYARVADKVEGIDVKGLKDRGLGAWFKSVMDKIKTPKLDKAKEEKTREEEPKGFKAIDQKAQELQAKNEKNLRDEVKYRQGTMDRFVKSYEELNGEKDFDIKTFMHQASRELSPSEYAELGRIVNGDRSNGGFKAMDKKAQELQVENKQKSEEEQLEGKFDEIISKADKRLSELREEDGVIVENNDELYDAAVQAILSSGEVKTSTIQRTLGIGYSRAAKLIDQMEEKGVISYDVSNHGYKANVQKQQSHKTQEGQAFSEKYVSTVDHEKALSNCESKQGTDEKTKQSEKTM